MPYPEERSLFDPKQFIDPETGLLTNFVEFDRQTATLIENGDVNEVLSFLATKVATDQPESHYYRCTLMNILDKINEPEAVLYHAGIIAEHEEQGGQHLMAAAASRVASSVYLEKDSLKDAANWFSRMRINLKESLGDEEVEFMARLKPLLLRGVLEFEGYYLLKLASIGKAKQARKDILYFIGNPIIPEEQHHLLSALAFLESDQGNSVAAMNALRKAEAKALEVGDYAHASIYASRRTTHLMVVFGGMGVKKALEDAENHLNQAKQTEIDPDLLAQAHGQLESRKEILS